MEPPGFARLLLGEVAFGGSEGVHDEQDVLGMRLLRLTVERLRNLDPLELRPATGLNLVTGDNGAGKTSLLEAIHLLAYGRSFRGRVRDGLIRTGAEDLEVFAEWEQGDGRLRRAGLRHGGQSWQGRLDGEPVRQLGELCAAFAALTFEPGSHALLGGGGEPRRRYLDWGLFHVERGGPGDSFNLLWRRYARALKQRNAALRQRADASQLEAWEQELVAAGEPLTRHREAYLERLQPALAACTAALAPSLGSARFQFQPGWRREQMSLTDALLLARERDRVSGYTSTGPHRADWRLLHGGRPSDEALSRGQAKLSALACLLAQAEDYAAHRGQWPLVLLDDLAAELDQAHQHRLLARLRDGQAQVFMTGTEPPEALRAIAEPVKQFHVEHGSITEQLIS